MAFSDPQTVTYDGDAVALARTGSGISSGSFGSQDSGLKLSFSHAANKSRDRRTVRLDFQQFMPDLVNPSINRLVTSSVYLVSNTPAGTLSIADQKLLVDAFLAYLAASSGAAVTKMLNGES